MEPDLLGYIFSFHAEHFYNQGSRQDYAIPQDHYHDHIALQIRLYRVSIGSGSNGSADRQGHRTRCCDTELSMSGFLTGPDDSGADGWYP